jgi:DNA-binding NarL/FixJ family response regulator
LITLVIADDHPMMRRGLREIVHASGRYHVVGEAGDGASAIRQLELLAPALALIDLAMPVADGFTVLEWARAYQPALRVVLLTMYVEPAYLDRALVLGAAGYLLKDDAEEELVRCLDQITSGGTYISPSVGHHAVKPPPPGAIAARLAELTPVQRVVLRHVGEARTSKEIARLTGQSYRTVQNHRARIAEVLGLRGANRLLDFAVRYRDLL